MSPEFNPPGTEKGGTNLQATKRADIPLTGQAGVRTPPDALHSSPKPIRNPHRLRNIVLKTVVGAGALTSAIAAGQHHINAGESISPSGITRDIQSIPGQIAEWFTGGDNGIVEPFNPNATEIVVGPNNSLQIPEDKYDNVPTIIDPNNPDIAINTLPIKYNVVNGKPIQLTVKRESGYLAGGNVLPGLRHVNVRTISVNNSVIIKDGLTQGSQIVFFSGEKDLHRLTIERYSRQNASNGETIKEETFEINGYNSKGERIIADQIDVASIKLLLDIPPAVIKKLPDGRYDLISTPVPLTPNVSFAEIVKPSQSGNFNGQLRFITNSQVTASDGTVHFGGIENVLANTDSKVNVVIKNK